MPYSVRTLILALAAGAVLGLSGASGEAATRILFMHHSTGEALIREGGVREALQSLGYEFWDHGYNGDGLFGPDGAPTGTSFDVPDDNTDPDGWAAVFSQPVTAPPANVFSFMLEYDVILFKSCFPASAIGDEEMLARYRLHYLAIRDAIDRHPGSLFVPFTPPPLVPNETDKESAARAKRWAAYLASEEYRGGRSNVAVFDFFSLLADASGVLREEFRTSEWDSHPNPLANETAGPLLVAFLRQAIERFRGQTP